MKNFGEMPKMEIPENNEYQEYAKGYKKDIEDLQNLNRGDFKNNEDFTQALHEAEDSITRSSMDINSSDFNRARASWDVFSKELETGGNLFIHDIALDRNGVSIFTEIKNEEMKKYVANKIDIESAADRVLRDKENSAKGHNYAVTALKPERVIKNLEIMIDENSEEVKNILQEKLERFKQLMKENNIES